jgi:hypothetical protein
MPAERNHFDETSAWFAKSDPAGVLTWLLRAPADRFTFRGWLDTKTIPFGSPDRRCDTVANLERVDPAGEPWAVTIEFQIEPDPLMFGRLLEYMARVWQVEKPSPERGDRFCLGAVVINLTGSGRAARNYAWPDLGLGCTLPVVERNLSRESAADTLTAIAAGTVSRSILPLIPLMHGGANLVLSRSGSDSGRPSRMTGGEVNSGRWLWCMPGQPTTRPSGKTASRSGT